MQDLEFTIENGRLFMLQCRTGKRTGLGAVRIAELALSVLLPLQRKDFEGIFKAMGTRPVPAEWGPSGVSCFCTGLAPAQRPPSTVLNNGFGGFPFAKPACA